MKEKIYNQDKILNMSLITLQPNQISQGFYRCSPMTKRILTFAMTHFPIITWQKAGTTEKETGYQLCFKQSAFIKSLGMQKTGLKQQELIKKALEELQSSYVGIETEDMFSTFAWVTSTQYFPKDKTIYIDFNPTLAKALIEYSKGFTTLQLYDLGKLQSFYAMRYYEIALSWKGKKGKDGNKKNEWWFEYDVSTLRKTFGIEDNEDYRMTNFFTKVIQKPLEEVNQKTELNITVEKIRDGREIVNWIFVCTEKIEHLKISKTDSRKLRDEKREINNEIEIVSKLKAKYPERWQEVFDFEMSQPCLFGGEEVKKTFAENKADLTLLQEFSNE